MSVFSPTPNASPSSQQEDQILIHNNQGLFRDSGKKFSQNVTDTSDEFVWDGPTAKSAIDKKIINLQQILKSTVDSWCPPEIGTTADNSSSSSTQYFKKLDGNSTTSSNFVIFKDGELADSGVRLNDADNVDPTMYGKTILSAAKTQNLIDNVKQNVSSKLQTDSEALKNTVTSFPYKNVATVETFLNFEGTWIPPVTNETDFAVMTESTPDAQLFGVGTLNFGKSWVNNLGSNINIYNSTFYGDLKTANFLAFDSNFKGQSPVNVIVIPDDGVYYVTISGKWRINYPLDLLTVGTTNSLTDKKGQFTIGLKNLRTGNICYTPDFISVCKPHMKSQRRAAATWQCQKGDKIAVIALQTIPEVQPGSTKTAQMWFKGSIFALSRQTFSS